MNQSRLVLCVRLLFFCLFIAVPGAVAQTASGTIEGRVQNAGTLNYLENVYVGIDGTELGTLTNAAGEFRIAHVPPGKISITAKILGYGAQAMTVEVGAGAVAQQNFVLERAQTSTAASDGIVQLDAFTVNARILSAQSAAIAEQRAARIIKNVVSFDEFGDISGDGNPGEFLKYVPGVNMNYGPDIAQFASIRGMPPTGTNVTMDGSPIGSSTGDRSFEMTGASTGNIDRIEITKSPTPDMPANTIGGAINIVGKSGFSRATPLFSYSLYENFDTLNARPGLRPSLGKKVSPDPVRLNGSTMEPGIDASYILPINKTIAFSFNGAASNRYHFYDRADTTWDLVNLDITTNSKGHVIVLSNRTLLSGTMDWKISKSDTLRLAATQSQEAFRVAQSNLNFLFGATATGNAFFSQSKAGAGSVTQSTTEDNSYRKTRIFTAKYKHDGSTWTIDADANYSSGNRRTTDVQDGTFSSFTASYTGLTLRGEGMDKVIYGGLPRIVATNASGAAVNVFDGGNMPVTAAAGATGLVSNDTIVGGRMNVERELSFSIPVKVKMGVSSFREHLDLTRTPYSWTFAPPAGTANTARNLGLTDDEFSSSLQWYDYDNHRVPITLISPAKLFALYKAHPEYFTLNTSAAYTGAVNASKVIDEIISAGYLMGDAKFLQKRLRIVGGVRFEATTDDGAGPKNDPSAVYVRDSAGNIVRNASGTPVRITTDALASAQLQLRERAAKSKRDYDGLYPSLNASYLVREDITARFAFAKTIARPAMSQILPGIVLPDPTTAASRTITVNNTGLRPWTSNNYDLSLEAYDIKGAVISAGVFRKDLNNFFTTTSAPTTPDFLAQYGLGSDYNGFDVATTKNGGSASLTGVEWSYRQALTFFPAWASGMNIFLNGTSLRLSGPNAADFTQFSPVSFNWGVGLVRTKFLAKVNVNHSGAVRTTAVAASASIPAGTYFILPQQTIVDVSFEYRLSKWISIYSNVRNANQSVKYTNAIAPNTPDYARNRVVQRYGALWTMGVKGQF